MCLGADKIPCGGVVHLTPNVMNFTRLPSVLLCRGLCLFVLSGLDIINAWLVCRGHVASVYLMTPEESSSRCTADTDLFRSTRSLIHTTKNSSRDVVFACFFPSGFISCRASHKPGGLFCRAVILISPQQEFCHCDIPFHKPDILHVPLVTSRCERILLILQFFSQQSSSE